MYEKICKVRENPVMGKILAFFDSEWFPVVYAALTLLCSFVGFEIAFFVLTALLIWFVTLFGRDSKPLLAIIVLFIYAISQRHTPQPPYNSEYLYGTPFLATVGTIAVISLGVLVFRLIAYPSTGNVFRGKPMARWGLFALAAALILNGVFYADYTFSNLLLGVVIAFSFLFFYIYFYHTLEWKDTTAVSIARILALACGVIVLQLVELYLFDGVIVDGSIDKGKIVLGWGMSNNAGGMLAMFTPALFYLAYKEKHGWIYYLLGLVSFFGVVMTCSRTSVLVGAVAVLACIVLLAIRGRNVRAIRIADIVLAVCVIVFCIIFRAKILELFQYYIDRGFDDSGRFEIYLNGMKRFLEAPIFGVGFYTPIAPDWSYEIENWLFPDMYHNTYVQLFASCGIVGVLAYTFHLGQGLVLCFRKFTPERLFYFIVLLVLTGISMGDNHIFHVFPAIVYSMLFALCEKDYEHKKAAETEAKGKESVVQTEQSEAENQDAHKDSQEEENA